MKEYNELLECLEDLVAQMQSEKITLEQAKQGVKSLNQYFLRGMDMEKNGKKKQKNVD